MPTNEPECIEGKNVRNIEIVYRIEGTGSVAIPWSLHPALGDDEAPRFARPSAPRDLRLPAGDCGLEIEHVLVCIPNGDGAEREVVLPKLIVLNAVHPVLERLHIRPPKQHREAFLTGVIVFGDTVEFEFNGVVPNPNAEGRPFVAGK